MTNNLNISCIQSNLIWEDKIQNMSNFASKIETLSKDSDIVILPEMFTTGFSMDSGKLSETLDGESLKWLKNQAVKSGKVIIGSLIISEAGKNYNRLIVMFPDGNYLSYDKRHLFRMGNEHEHYAKGEKRMIFNFKGWRIYPLICYDLRFPVWSRNKNDYDLLIYIANWPETRREVWKSLLVARAIENQAYVIGVNRVGNDGEGISYAGDSLIINPRGQIVSKATEYMDEIINAELSLDELNAFREKFPVNLDADEFIIKL